MRSISHRAPQVDDDPEDGHPEPVEQQPSKWAERLVLDLAEADEELRIACLDRAVRLIDAAPEARFEVGQCMLIKRLARQLGHALDSGHDAVAARLGQQRAVIAGTLVGIGTRQVDDLGLGFAEKLRARQVVPRGHHLVRRVGVGEVAILIDEDEPAHGAVNFSTKMAALRRDVPLGSCVRIPQGE